MTRKILVTISLAIIAAALAVPAEAQHINYSVQKIWDNGSHCAFTSLIRFKGRYYCSFREGVTHIFDEQGNAEGKIRILVSDDGERWEALPLIGKEGYDLRDPKLSITPDGRLMVIAGGSIYREQRIVGRIPQVLFSEDGRTFTAPEAVILDAAASSGTDWLWRVMWDGETGYGVNYAMRPDGGADLYLVSTRDGIHYGHVATLPLDGFPNETTVRMLPDGRMAMMVRRDKGDTMGYWGVSEPPFTDWKFTKMEFRVGGPDFLVLGDGTIIAGSRSYYIPSACKTALYKGTADGRFQEVMLLPSGGDTSYPGLLVDGDTLWVSYYSSHETPNASIYLARIPIAALGIR